MGFDAAGKADGIEPPPPEHAANVDEMRRVSPRPAPFAMERTMMILPFFIGL